MKDFFDIKNKLVEDGIISAEQFIRTDENSFMIRLDDEYTLFADDDQVSLHKNADKPWKAKHTHTHQDMFEGTVYEATYQIVKEYSGEYKTIFKKNAVSDLLSSIIVIIAILIIYMVFVYGLRMIV